MNFYSTCQCSNHYHINNAYGCPRCNNQLLIQVEIIDDQIKKLQARRALLLAAYEAEKVASQQQCYPVKTEEHNTMTQQEIKTMLADPATRAQALDRLGEWAKDNCLMQGATPSTAYIVAWLLVEGIAATWEDRKRSTWVGR